MSSSKHVKENVSQYMYNFKIVPQ